MRLKFTAKDISFLSFFIALSIVFTRIIRVPIPVVGDFLNFGGFPIVLSGLIMGPLAGGIVGGVSDVVGYPLAPKALYFPHFTLTAILAGVIPALIFNALGYTVNKLPSRWVLFAIIFAGLFVSNVLLAPIFLNLLLGFPLWLWIPKRFLSEIFHSIIYANIALSIIRRFSSVRVLPAPLP
ncbi:MAG: folate family ECF transporter S component [bacterium]